MRSILHGLAAVLGSLLALPVAAQPYAYVPNYGSNDVSVIDTATDTVVATIGVTCANGVAVHTASQRAYVTNWCSGQLEVIDTSSNTLLAPLATNGQNPNAVAVNASGTLAFVVNESDGDANVNGELAIIDLGTGSVLVEVPLGFLSFGGVAVHPDGSTVYVTSKCVDIGNCGSPGLISAIATTAPYTRTDRTAGLQAVGVAISPDGSKVYVTSHQNPLNASQGLLTVLDTATSAISHVPTSGEGAYGVAVHHGTGHIYVSNFHSNSVSVFDSGSLAEVATVAVGANPIGLDVHPDGSRVYAANYGSGSVSVINAVSNTVAGTLTVGSLPHAYGRFIQGPSSDIAGTVTTSSGVAMSGITVTTGALSATTDGSGVYSFTNLANGSYTFAPSVYNYTFAPTSRTVILSGVDATAQNFVGTYNGIPDITDLRAMVVAANLSDTKLRNTLLMRLDAALDSLNGSSPNRVGQACSNLDKFIAAVRKNIATDHPWIAAANDILALSGCPTR